MLSTILGALLPVVITILLGFLAAWHHDFNEKQAVILNRMVLLYAVPMGLFAGTVSTQRAVLSQDIPLAVALFAAILGLYGAGFLVSRMIFRAPTGIAALAALAASAPAVPFIGPAVLGDLLGNSSAVPIGISSLIINLTVVPITILILSLNSKQPDDQALAPNSQPSPEASSRYFILVSTLVRTVKQPIVWVPLVAFAFVLAGIRIPHLIIHSLSLLGSAAGGVALFASGIILAATPIRISKSVLTMVALKNIVQPALVFVALEYLSYTGIATEAVLTTAIPMMPIVIMLATQYRIAQAEAASEVFISSVSSVITMGAFIALTSMKHLTI
jgi:malonate transporter